MLAGVIVSSVGGGLTGLALMLAAEQGGMALLLSYFAGGTTTALGFILSALRTLPRS